MLLNFLEFIRRRSEISMPSMINLAGRLHKNTILPHTKLKLRRKNTGITTIIAATFMVVIIMVGLGAMAWSLGLQNNFSQTITEKNLSDIERVNESIEIRDVRIDNSRFNMTVVNTGALPTKIVRMWVTNVTDTNGWQQQYDFSKFIVINPGESATGIGTDLSVVATNSSSYRFNLVTERGSSANFLLSYAKDNIIKLNLFASPKSTPTGQEITLILSVTNDLPNSNALQSINPSINWTRVEAAIGSTNATATLVSGPTPTIEKSIGTSETAFFKWIYNIAGDIGDTINFNATLVGGKQGNYVLESVEIIADSFAEQSTASAETLDISSSITSFKEGTCSIPNGSTSVNCIISPALTDTTKTFMIFQASSNNDRPDNSNIRCFVKSLTQIFCDRISNTGTININWQTAEFAEGVTVQHLLPPCASTAVTKVDIADVDVAKTFLLYSSAHDGAAQSGTAFRTVWLKDNNEVEITRSSSVSCGTHLQALQVIQFDDASVTRGVTSSTMTGISQSVSGLSSVDTDRTMLFYTYRTAISGSTMCDRMLRGDVASSTQITFTRNCTTGGAIEAISWQRVTFNQGGLVRKVTVNMNDGMGALNSTIAAVDPSKTLVFAGGQVMSGQSIGEGSLSSNDILGAMVGRHRLVDSTTLEVVRDNTQGSAKWTSYAVQFGNFVIFNGADLEIDILNAGSNRIWVDSNSRIVLNNTQTGAMYAGLIKSWKNQTASTTGIINGTIDSDAIEPNAALKLVFKEPSKIPGDLSSGGVKATPGLYSAYIRLSGYDETGKFVIRVPVGTVEIPAS